jgi:hypothetical protein
VDSVLVGDEVVAAGEAVSKPRFVVQLALPQGQRGDPVELRFGQHQGKWYAQRLGEKYVVSVTELDDERILAPWWDYVERIAFRVDRQRQPNRVIVRDGGERASVPERIYERGPSGRWMLGDEEARAFEERTWDRLLELKAERALGELRPADLEQRELLRTVRVQHVRAPGAKPKDLHLLRLYRGENGRLLSWRDDDELVFELWEGL